jgi:hypothetical protein
MWHESWPSQMYTGLLVALLPTACSVSQPPGSSLTHSQIAKVEQHCTSTFSANKDSEAFARLVLDDPTVSARSASCSGLASALRNGTITRAEMGASPQDNETIAPKALYAYRRSRGPATYKVINEQDLPEQQRPAFQACLENHPTMPDFLRYGLAVAYDANVEDAVNVGCYENLLAIDQGMAGRMWAEKPDLLGIGKDIGRIRDLMRERASLTEDTASLDISAHTEFAAHRRPPLPKVLSEACKQLFQSHPLDENDLALLRVFLNDPDAEARAVFCEGMALAVESGSISYRLREVLT